MTSTTNTDLRDTIRAKGQLHTIYADPTVRAALGAFLARPGGDEATAVVASISAALAAPAQAPAVPEVFWTHKDAWRDAIQQMQARGLTSEDDEHLYWSHELQAFDDAYDALAVAHPAEAVPAPGAPSDATCESLLAECRDAFPVPPAGSPLEVHWAAAMTSPNEVPNYLRKIAAAESAAPAQAGKQKTLPIAITSAPDRIWLDLGFNPYEEDVHFSDLHDLTWSNDNPTGDGIEYVRADLAARGAAQAAPAQGVDEAVIAILHDVRSYGNAREEHADTKASAWIGQIKMRLDSALAAQAVPAEARQLHGDAKLAHDQCRAVVSLANSVAEVYAARAAIVEHDSSLANQIGPDSAAAMERLGDELNASDAAEEEDEWIDPIFAAAQERWPQSAQAAPVDASMKRDAERLRTLLNLSGARKRIWNHVLEDSVKALGDRIEDVLDAARAAQEGK